MQNTYQENLNFYPSPATKIASENVKCWSCLLHVNAYVHDLIPHNDKQCEPRGKVWSESTLFATRKSRQHLVVISSPRVNLQSTSAGTQEFLGGIERIMCSIYSPVQKEWLVTSCCFLYEAEGLLKHSEALFLYFRNYTCVLMHLHLPGS